jgi:hypothetical protein
MTFDMPRRTIGLESSVEGARQSQILQSLSYSAENRARFGGNVLFGDRTLGAPGYELANRMSAAEMERRRSAESLQATGTGLSTAVGLGQMILGGATIAATGWTGIGGILGAGLMASGFGTMGTGLVSAAQNTRVQETGMLDAFGPFSSYAGATRQAQQMQARDALMNAALERNKVNIASQDAYQSQMDTWNQNIRSAGALAVSPMDVVGQSRSVSDTVAVQAGRDAVNAYVKSKDTAARASVRKDLANEAVGRDWSYGHMPGVDVWAPVDAADVKRAADLVSIKQKARTDSLNTQLTKNVQEQSMQLLDTTWAKYGISADEWSTKVSNVSSRLGVGAMGMSKRAREATTERILNMSMAGVGTFEQIAGNQEILSSITGRTDATKDVEKVLRNAVKAGFDDSRTGQAFMQNVVQLSSALGLRSTDQVSGRIGLGTRLLGGTEKDMEAMTRGMAQVPAMFEQSRVIGGLNFASFVAGGGLELKGSFAQTAFDISKNPERALKVREDVERLRKKGLKEGATASKINQLLESQEFKDIDPEVRGILLTEGVGGLDKFTQAATTGYRSLISMSGIDKEKEALLSKFRGKKTLTKQEKEELKMGMQGLRYRGRDMFMALGQSEEAATAATSYALTDLGDDRALVEQAFGSKGSFERQMKQGSGDSERAAAIRRYDVTQRAALAAQAAGKAKDPLTDEQLGDLAVGGKIQFMSGKGAQARQQEIDVTRAQQLIKPGAQAQGGVEKAFKEWATNNNQLQASLQQQMLTSLESVLSGKTQQVYVMNWEGMVVAQSTFKDLPAPGHK